MDQTKNYVSTAPEGNEKRIFEKRKSDKFIVLVMEDHDSKVGFSNTIVIFKISEISLERSLNKSL